MLQSILFTQCLRKADLSFVYEVLRFHLLGCAWSSVFIRLNSCIYLWFKVLHILRESIASWIIEIRKISLLVMSSESLKAMILTLQPSQPTLSTLMIASAWYHSRYCFPFGTMFRNAKNKFFILFNSPFDIWRA